MAAEKFKAVDAFLPERVHCAGRGNNLPEGKRAGPWVLVPGAFAALDMVVSSLCFFFCRWNAAGSDPQTEK